MPKSLDEFGKPDALVCRHCDGFRIVVGDILFCRTCDSPPPAKVGGQPATWTERLP